MSSKIAVAGLVTVAALWGLTFPLIEQSVQLQDPFLFVALRFSFAAIFLIPYFLKNISKQVLVVGSMLGLMNCGAFLTQTIGLQTVPSSRAAFITGINVLIIPFIAPLFKMRAPRISDIVCMVICFIGIYILIGCDIGHFTVGDGWIFLCVFFIAFSIVYIAYHAKKDFHPMLLTSSQIVMTAIFAWITCFFFGNFDCTALHYPRFLINMFICSIFSTVIAIILQSKYQKYVSAQKAALVFSLEPVFAAFFDTLLNGARPDRYLIFGGSIILMSIVILEKWQSLHLVKRRDS